MEFKGTKGRWEINRWGNVFGENEEVAYMPSLTPKKEKEANALLISKAPEMLEMLKNINNYIENNRDKNYMIELMRREFYQLEQLIKEATEI